MRIAVGSDHAGFKLKSAVVAHLQKTGVDIIDKGCHSSERVDYPDYGAAVAMDVTQGAADLGICVCGSGIGISIAANKVAGCRAALVHDTTTAHLCREHNNANVLCLGERTTGEAVALEAVDAFLAATFEGGRHQGRLDKIAALETKTSAASTSTADDAALQALEAQWVKFGAVFMSWWSSTDHDTRRALLESARDLLLQRLAEDSTAAAAAATLGALCPELHGKLERLVPAAVLPALINARLTEPDKAAAHDHAYAAANCGDAAAQAANRTRLMLTFLTDVVLLGEHASMH